MSQETDARVLVVDDDPAVMPTERDTLVQLGCDLLQGYLFAKPSRSFEAPRW
jgi:predicted signal transduction protein with EAL and GGDEF domain